MERERKRSEGIVEQVRREGAKERKEIYKKEDRLSHGF